VAILAVALARTGIVPAAIGVAAVVMIFGTVAVVTAFPCMLVESAWLAKPFAVSLPSREKVRCGAPTIASNKDILMQMSRKARSTFALLLL
jgi:hypothetical protein